MHIAPKSRRPIDSSSKGQLRVYVQHATARFEPFRTMTRSRDVLRNVRLFQKTSGIGRAGARLALKRAFQGLAFRGSRARGGLLRGI
jgi:hypothetical protein